MDIIINGKEVSIKDTLPVIPMRNLVIFPQLIVPLVIGRSQSIKATEVAYNSDKIFFCVTQKSSTTQKPNISDLYQTGVICQILQILKMPDTTIRILAEGIKRAKILKLNSNKEFISAKLSLIESEYFLESSENRAIMRALESEFKEYAKLTRNFPEDIMITFANLAQAEDKTDFIAANIELDIEMKQRLLEYPLIRRIFYLIELISKELEILKIRNKIAGKVRHKLTKSQKEYFLNQELKVIQKELGLTEDETVEIKEIDKKLKKLKLSEEAREKANYELNKLKRTNRMSPEYSVSVNYLNWIIELPWGITPKLQEFNLKKAEKILDDDHYGLKKIKERIVEYLAVLKMVDKVKGQILCFVGPPGVGKTSLGKSIARALNRKFVRLSLGGVRDEAEIRGHRKTYIGAMPGIIIQSMKRAGTKNPIIMLDEVDKMSMDFRGDPSAALLEVLDSEQNFEFHDHYIEVGYDLSQVLFITTANDIYSIPIPLKDRMEVITLPGYTEFEKQKIAQGFLILKQLKNHGLDKGIKVEFTENAIFSIIRNYTREAGVRELERNIAAILRKIVREYLNNNSLKHFKITSKSLSKYLGVEKYLYSDINKENRIGVANGLAWTPVGGVPLQIQVALLEGKGGLVLTGKLGDVMKESANAALSYARAHYADFGIKKDFYKNKDIHIHIPEGAIPKDGPSAGITMATAVISALSNKKVKADFAMTGEITLMGDVLPVGGLEEKLVAAQRSKIKNVIIPMKNNKELTEITKQIKKGLNIIPVENMSEVLSLTIEN
ncbi:MAG: endopeptidase La [Candidatus Cloacimonetes bacterium]|nr:endopeptidase La [Candidatus Cloacimonadota bacterium]MBL7086259.1 endopeptidase La [Candidatus Cloacimonadota bacterium]